MTETPAKRTRGRSSKRRASPAKGTAEQRNVARKQRNVARPPTVAGRRRFLEAYAETGNVKASCELAKVGRKTHYRWLADPGYSAAFEAAGVEAVDVLEREARRRAVEGVEEAVYGSLGQGQGSGEIGRVRKYSDVLLIFLLKGAKPATYRERYEEVTPSQPLASTLSDAELDAELRKYAQKVQLP